MTRRYGALLAALLAAPASGASLDDVLEGFESLAPAPAAPVAAPAATGEGLRISGDIGLSAVWNTAHEAPLPGATDHRGLSRARLRLGLQLDAPLGERWAARLAGHAQHDAVFDLRDDAGFAPALVSERENEAELGEAWLRGRIGAAVDLKLGRQIVVWGKSDSLRVTDVLNPIDNREPGMVDVKDLRLPLAMTRVDFYAGRWNLMAAAIHEIRFNRNPVFGSDFHAAPAPLPPEVVPEDAGAGTEFALAANGLFSGWDLSFYAARLFDDQAWQDMTAIPAVRRHARTTMLGAAANIAAGNWLWKAEVARFDALRLATVAADYRRTDALVGADWSGLTDATLSLELVDRHVHGYDTALAAAGQVRDEWQAALRYQGEFLRARLRITAVATRVADSPGGLASGGGFTRASAAWDLRDALTLTGGHVAYHRGERLPFSAFGANDRVFLELRLSF